jgi:hypothetical protein
MIGFIFNVNDSFLCYPTHPITIPRSKVDYAQIRGLLALSDDVWIHLAQIGAWPARIVGHTAGFGPYYQIRCVGHVPLTRAGLSKGVPLFVSLVFADQRIEVHVCCFTTSSSIGQLTGLS